MIIHDVTLKIKNIIFFKAVLSLMVFSTTTYFINYQKDVKSTIKAKEIRANQILNDAKSRLEVLENDIKILSQTIEEYKVLKEKSTDPVCFDKVLYQEKVKSIEKSLGLKDQVSIYSSSNSVLRKDQPLHTVLIKTTKVRLNYLSHDFLTSVKLARMAYEALPEYNYATSYEIKKNNSITPDLIDSIGKSTSSNLIYTTLNLEVKELTLNENDK